MLTLLVASHPSRTVCREPGLSDHLLSCKFRSLQVLDPRLLLSFFTLQFQGAQRLMALETERRGIKVLDQVVTRLIISLSPLPMNTGSTVGTTQANSFPA